MSHHIQHHSQYVHYTGPPGTHIQTQPVHTISPLDITRHVQQPQQPQQHPQQQQQQQLAPPPQPQQHHQQQSAPASGSSTSAPLVATGDWTKDLVHLAKTAELKRHALTLQLHTAHILSAHASLEQKSKAVQDIREQKNKLESERTRLLNCLREINEDRDKADIMEVSVTRECDDLRNKITQLTEGDYAIAKRDVDRLRQELGQPPIPSIQSTLDEKTSQYLTDRRLGGNEVQNPSVAAKRQPKRSAAVAGAGAGELDGQGASKRPRGRPRGSKNKKGD